MESHPAALEGRVSALEREMVGLKATIRAAIAVMLFMGGGYLWYASRSIDTMETVIKSVNSIQTDVLLIKKDNERKDWERRLITQMVKKGGGSDVSKTLIDE